MEAGLGAGCLSRISLVEAIARGSLVPLSAPARDFSRELYIILHRRKFRSALLRQWMALCLGAWRADSGPGQGGVPIAGPAGEEGR